MGLVDEVKKQEARDQDDDGNPEMDVGEDGSGAERRIVFRRRHRLR